MNTFTDAHLGIEAKLLAWIAEDDRTASSTPAILRARLGSIKLLEERADEIAVSVSKELLNVNAGTLAALPHDFVTYAACRLLAVCDHEVPSNLLSRVQASVAAQIAHHSAGSTARFDLGALLFGIALLAQGPRFYEPLVARGLEIIATCQAGDGSWPELRAIYWGGHSLFISSYEVGLTLCNLGLRRLSEIGLVATGVIQEMVDKTLGLARTELRHVPAKRSGTTQLGWANDRNPSREIIESWTTAIVCSMAVRSAELSSRANLVTAFQKYDGDHSSTLATSSAWPDLERFRLVARRKTELKAAALERDGQPRLSLSDPTDAGDIAFVLDDQFVQPVLLDWTARPNRSGVSLLLPGDPGTRKTTLVKELARVLEWPVLTLTPPVFLRGGLERFEAEAAAIFSDLQGLERVVVFFDECEEFFRHRHRSGDAAASRTVGAFITAGMLPRLQSMHDRGELIFVVATNAAAGDLDPAAIRPGRFDRRFDMLHPSRTAQERYLRAVLRASGTSGVKQKLSAYFTAVDAAARPDVTDRVPFTALDDFAEILAGNRRLEPELLLAHIASAKGIESE